MTMPDIDPVIQHLIDWAASLEEVRAMLLYSSRANPGAPLDRFSDYDVLIFLRERADVHRFRQEDNWLEQFGQIMVIFRNPLEQNQGFDHFGYVTHDADGTKIDFAFYPVAYLEWLSTQPRLPDYLDLGYRVLYDPESRARNLPQSTGSAYLTPPPTSRQYRELIDEFFNDSCYVAKCLQRDDLFLAKHCLDEIMKFNCLRTMLEWQAKAGQDWKIRTGAYGKGLKKRVDPATWTELESTYVGAGQEENWQALFRTIDLFSRVAREVGACLGYDYPEEMHQSVTIYLAKVRNYR